jgi:hypothetical protein
MNDVWFKVKLWTKLSVIALLILFVIIFSYENYSQQVNVWLIRTHTMSVLELLVGTFLFGMLVTLLARPAFHTLKQISQLRRKKPEHQITAVPTPTPPPPVKP